MVRILHDAVFVFISVGRDGNDGRDGIPGMNGIPGRQGLPGKWPLHALYKRDQLDNVLILLCSIFSISCWSTDQIL